MYDLRVTNPWPYAALDNYIHFRLRAGWASHAPTGLDPIPACRRAGIYIGRQAEDRLRPCRRML